MKKYVTPFILLTLTTAAGFASEEKTKISLCPAEEFSTLGNEVKQRLQETGEKVATLAHNNAEVKQGFQVLSDLLLTAYQKEKSLTAQEVTEICKAIDFAAEKHRLQTRKNKEKTPYIVHLLGVTYNLMQIGDVREAPVIVASLLHDTVEDTQTTLSELETHFGKRVASLVQEVTDDKSLAKEMRKRLQVINAAHKSKEAAQIKLADKLYNLNDLISHPPADWSQTRIDHYYEWAQSVVDRLPKSNDKLFNAVEGVINRYWEQQAKPS